MHAMPRAPPLALTGSNGDISGVPGLPEDQNDDSVRNLNGTSLSLRHSIKKRMTEMEGR